jgi:hypothetical protein
MPPDRHKNQPLRFRPPEPERLWLLDYQQRSGKPMNKILTDAVRALQAITPDLAWVPDEGDVDG